MSLGPNTTENRIEISKVDRIRHFTKKVVVGYFERPTYYRFYGARFATIVGLYFGMDFSWQFYAGLGILSAFNLYDCFKKYDRNRSTNSGD